MTEEQKDFLKKIGKFAAFTAVTGGAYILAKGAISLLLKKLEAKAEAEQKAHRKKREVPPIQPPTVEEKPKMRSATP